GRLSDDARRFPSHHREVGTRGAESAAPAGSAGRSDCARGGLAGYLPMKPIDFARYRGLRFDDFRRLASDPRLSSYEKIGFPPSYRKGKDAAVLADIAVKLRHLSGTRKTVLDIGCGCSELVKLLIAHCARRRHRLLLV